MRKLLFVILIIILLIFTGIVIAQGTNIGSTDIWGIQQISEKNKEIDNQISQLDSLITSSYPGEIAKLNTSSEQLQEIKKQYEEKAILLAENKYYKYMEKYKHEFILTKIGTYADDNNVDIRIVVVKSDTSGLYDINFTITGKYADVASYIYDIENDTKLGFKIEDFIMVSATATVKNEDGTTYTTDAVKANFNCKEITIDLKWIDENKDVIPGIITRGNPFINSSTTLSDEYSDEELDTSRTTKSSQASEETSENQEGQDNQKTQENNGVEGTTSSETTTTNQNDTNNTNATTTNATTTNTTTTNTTTTSNANSNVNTENNSSATAEAGSSTESTTNY